MGAGHSSILHGLKNYTSGRTTFQGAGHVAVALEKEFDKPVICNQAAVIRTALQMLDKWTPQKGHSQLLALP